GSPTEASNVRAGEDLESYESDFRLLQQLRAWGLLQYPQETAALRAAPEGFVPVPAEPTEAMIIAGVSSFPSRPFTPLEEWEIYQEMSGCEQAAYCAKKCWAAMLAFARRG
ncbi:MAG: hypothetical protein RSG92_29140, partial [Pseudomonas sp.]